MSEDLRALGYTLLPIPPIRKEPPPPGWINRTEAYFIPPGWNVAVGARGDVAILITNDEASTVWARGQHGPPNVRSVRGGHWYFCPREGQVNESNRETSVGTMEFHVSNKYALVPPSVHPSGARYEWERPLPPVAELPLAPDLRDLFHPGGTHQSELLTQSAAKAHAGLTEEQITNELVAWRDRHLPDPQAHPDKDIRRLARSAFLKFADRGRGRDVEASERPLPVPESRDYADLWAPDPRNKDAKVPRWAHFREHLEQEYAFVAYRDSEKGLLRYRGGLYEDDGRQVISEWIEARFREVEKSSPTRGIEEVVQSVRRAHYVPRDEFNPSGFLPVTNGVLDLSDPKAPRFSEHDPHRRFTFRLDVPYRPEQGCSSFEKFLARILPDPKARSITQEEFGYTLVPGNPYKVAFFWVGAADTGKSTLLAVLRLILGRKNVSAVPLQKLAENTFATASLWGKLANLVPDLPVRAVRDVGTFKMLVSGNDEVPAEKKFEPAFSFINPAKLFFSANELPAVPWADDAFFRRWILTTFAAAIPLAEQQEGIDLELVRNEGAGILNWALEGLKRLKERGRFEAEALAGAATTWKRHSSSLVAFAEDALEVAKETPPPSVEKARLWEAYVAYCQDEGQEPVTAAQLGRDLPVLLPGVFATVGKRLVGRKETSVRIWRGVRLRRRAIAEPGGSTGSTGSTGGTRIPPRAREGDSTGMQKLPVEGVEGVEGARGTARAGFDQGAYEEGL